MTDASVIPAVASPTVMLPGVTTTVAGKRLGELVDRVVGGERIAIVRNERRPAVLVSSAWYDRQPGAGAFMLGVKATDGGTLRRDTYVTAVGERANTNRTAPIQLDAVEAETVAELLGELAAAYTDADPVGRLARQCAVILYNRLGV